MARIVSAFPLSDDTVVVVLDDGSVFESGGVDGWYEQQPIPRTPAASREADAEIRERAEAAGLHIPGNFDG